MKAMTKHVVLSYAKYQKDQSDRRFHKYDSFLKAKKSRLLNLILRPIAKDDVPIIVRS